MDTVLNKISEIESAAVSIMDDANLRKKDFAKEIKEKTDQFDVQMESETSKKIDDLRAELEINMKAKLSKQKSDAEEVVKLLEDNYHVHHQDYARKLFQSMIEE